MAKIKIWTQTELNKGHIPSDKITRRGVKFETYSLVNFDKSLNKDNFDLTYNRYKDYSAVISFIRGGISQSNKFKQMEADGYHSHIYLNLNKDGVDCFISR